jgi:hypothetical protein
MGVRHAVAAALVAAAMIGVPVAATASTPRTTGWQRYPYASVTEPAGTACTFALRVDPVRQDVRYLTTASYPDGDPEDQIWAGPLYMRYTDEANGKSLVADLSGTAYIHYDPDGTQHWYGIGPFGLAVHPGNPYLAAGEYVASGVTVLVLHAGTTPELTFHSRPLRDVCAELG